MSAVWFTRRIVRYSQQHGRLILFPTYDDCGYFEDAARWLTLLRDGTWRDAVNAFESNPPHSPYSTALAAVSLWLSGWRDWAPYAASGWIVLALLPWCVCVTRRQPMMQRLLVMVFALTLPLLGVAVAEFRPDAAFGLICATAYFAMLGIPRLRCPLGAPIAGGALFGIALLTKPVAFPLVAVMWFTATLASMWIWAPAHGSLIRGVWDWLGTASTSLIACSTVSGWYLWVAGPRIVAYLRDNYLGAMRDVWTRHDDWLSSAAYYLGGPDCPLGRHAYLLAPLLIVGLVFGLCSVQRQRRRLTIGIAAGLAVAYLVPTLGRANDPFFAQAFLYATFMAAVLALRQMTLLLRRRRVASLVILAPYVCATLVGLYLFQWPTKVGDRDADWIRNRREIVGGVYEMTSARSSGRPRTVFLTTIGDVNQCTMNYLALRDERPVTYLAAANESSAEAMLAACRNADFVVASESGTQLQADYLPCHEIQDEVLGRLVSDSMFREIGYFEYRPSKRGFHVFERFVPAAPN